MRKASTITVKRLVRITATGKFSLTLGVRAKVCLRNMIMVYMNDRQSKLNFGSTVFLWLQYCLIEEIYFKHFRELHLNRDGKVLLTRAQAYALWMTCQNELTTEGRMDVGNLLNQLHQKLS